jgi:hypothetical protein
MSSNLTGCRLLYAISLLVIGSVGSRVWADTVLNQYSLFSGTDIYSPTVFFDQQAGIYKMWYGGWQSCGNLNCHDQIYYRTSTDAVHWSGFSTVVTSSQIGSNIYSVNDPSVTKHFNNTNQKYQYTMFFTACVNPCSSPADNQLWSATSGDGISWVYPQQIITGGSGSATPSAIIDPQANGTFWKIYYTNTGNDTIDVFMAEVDGNRYYLGSQLVFTYNMSNQAIANPEVRNVNGSWELFFNIYGGNMANIAKTVSTVNTSWPTNTSTLLIDNSGPTYCGTIAPGVYALSNGQYQMYFGLTPRQSNGTCDLTKQGTIDLWTWQQ